MTNRHTATLPDGRIATRTSKSRTYTHVIAVADTAAQAAADRRSSAAWSTRSADHHEGTEPSRYSTAEQIAQRVADYRAAAANAIAEAERYEAMPDQGAAVNWCAMTWCGRPDLARAAARRLSGPGRYVEIIEAQMSS